MWVSGFEDEQQKQDGKYDIPKSPEDMAMRYHAAGVTGRTDLFSGIEGRGRVGVLKMSNISKIRSVIIMLRL